MPDQPSREEREAAARRQVAELAKERTDSKRAQELIDEALRPQPKQ